MMLDIDTIDDNDFWEWYSLKIRKGQGLATVGIKEILIEYLEQRDEK